MNPMQMRHYALAKAAIAASLTTTVLSLGIALAQSKPGANASDTAIHLVVNGPEDDPNMPELPYAIPGAPIFWIPQDGIPQVTFLKPRSVGAYLGFNEKGSWIRNSADNKAYVWNLKDQTLTLGAESEAGVPLNLRNPSLLIKTLIAKATGRGTTGATVANNNKAGSTPYIPPDLAGDGNAQHGGGEAHSGNSAPGTANSASASRQIRGSGATIKAGVLTFILDDPTSPDNGKPVSLKVMRAAMTNPNAAKANGIAGAWLAEDPKNKDGVISLYVQENGAVSGTAMTGFAAETLKKIMNAKQQ